MRGANFIVFLLLARSLALAEFGFYGFLISALLLVSVACDFGLRQSFAKSIGQGKITADQAFWHSLAAWLPLTFLAGFLLYMSLQFFPQPETMTLPLALVLAMAPPVLFVRIAHGLLLGSGQLGGFNRSELAPRAVLLIGIVALWLIDAITLERVLWLLWLSYLSAAAVILVECRTALTTKPALAWHTLRDLAVTGLGFMVGIVAMMAFGRSGLIATSTLLDAEASGIYFGIMRLSEMIVEIAMAVGISLFSHGVRADDNAASARSLFAVSIAVTSMIALVALILCLLAQPILQLVMPEVPASAVPAFQLLLAAAVPASLAAMLHPGLASRGLPLLGAAAFACGLLVMALGAWVVVPHFGLTGLAALFLGAAIMVAAAQCVIYRKRFKVTLSDAGQTFQTGFSMILRRLRRATPQT